MLGCFIDTGDTCFLIFAWSGMVALLGEEIFSFKVCTVQFGVTAEIHHLYEHFALLNMDNSGYACFL